MHSNTLDTCRRLAKALSVPVYSMSGTSDLEVQQSLSRASVLNPRVWLLCRVLVVCGMLCQLLSHATKAPAGRISAMMQQGPGEACYESKKSGTSKSEHAMRKCHSYQLDAWNVPSTPSTAPFAAMQRAWLLEKQSLEANHDHQLPGIVILTQPVQKQHVAHQASRQCAWDIIEHMRIAAKSMHLAPSHVDWGCTGVEGYGCPVSHRLKVTCGCQAASRGTLGQTLSRTLWTHCCACSQQDLHHSGATQGVPPRRTPLRYFAWHLAVQHERLARGEFAVSSR
jgi:hypothetical protein